ncbi:MAG TPA: penicillin-binding protein 2, partial [Rhizomicrobium sp.]|nr:penicillin-binding protein 2 [Rhizomicrobium sp.]
MGSSKAPTILQRRIAITAGLCVMAFALVGLRLADITILKGRVSGSHVAAIVAPSHHRADIVDRNGELLARDLPVHDVYARPHAFWDKAQAARDLAAVTHTSEKRLKRIFTHYNHDNAYVLIARKVTPDTQDKVMQLGLPGLDFVQSTKRYYPKGRAAVQVLGQTDPDGNGVSGLEYGLNAKLNDAKPGAQVKLSLDMRVQYAVAREVEAAREQYNARAAGGIVMNVDTGEIIAMVSLPDGITGNRELGNADPRRNRMTQDVYELGSVFKIFAFALALEDHTIRLDEEFPIGKGFKIGKYTIHDAERMPAEMTAKEILAESSNAGTAQIALRSGATRQREFLGELGLLRAPQAEIPETAAPLTPRHWGDIETATIGFGHGLSVSPLAFATAAAMVVNGGRRINPTFLKQSHDARGAQIIAPDVSVTMRNLLRYVVTDGTGKKADVPGYDVGGKTGSAEKPGRGGYIAHKLLTSFCAIFPSSDPRYLVFVMLDEPHGRVPV